MTHSYRRFAVLAALFMLGACSHIQSISAQTGVAPGLSASQRVRSALELLDQGEENRAKAELEAALEEQPGDNTAQRLLEQINTDPRALLGERNRAYVVRNGETMSTLAERFLGDPLLFYALSRYNDIAAPNTLHAGQNILVPERQRTTTASVARPITPASPSAVAANPTAPPPRPGADPARASQLRLAALEQLNVGAVDRAVTLLRQAQGFDRDNPAIQRDLDRALRVQASLRGRAS